MDISTKHKHLESTPLGPQHTHTSLLSLPPHLLTRIFHHGAESRFFANVRLTCKAFKSAVSPCIIGLNFNRRAVARIFDRFGPGVQEGGERGKDVLSRLAVQLSAAFPHATHVTWGGEQRGTLQQIELAHHFIMQLVSHLPGVTYLDVQRCHGSPALAAHLGEYFQIRGLKHLESELPLSEDNLSKLAANSSITSLSCDVKESHQQARGARSDSLAGNPRPFPQMPTSLVRLSLSCSMPWARGWARWLEWLGSATHLTSLNVTCSMSNYQPEEYEELDAHMAAALARLTELREFKYGIEFVWGSRTWESLRGLPNLQTLVIHSEHHPTINTGYQDQSVHPSALESLCLTVFPPADIKPSQTTALPTASSTQSDMQKDLPIAAALYSLGLNHPVPSLARLVLSDCQDKSALPVLQMVGKHKGLRELVVDIMGVPAAQGTACAECVAGLSELTLLRFFCGIDAGPNNITSFMAPTMQLLTNLRSLAVTLCITHAENLQFLASLQSLPSLRTLKLQVQTGASPGREPAPQVNPPASFNAAVAFLDGHVLSLATAPAPHSTQHADAVHMALRGADTSTGSTSNPDAAQASFTLDNVTKLIVDAGAPDVAQASFTLDNITKLIVDAGAPNAADFGHILPLFPALHTFCMTAHLSTFAHASLYTAQNLLGLARCSKLRNLSLDWGRSTSGIPDRDFLVWKKTFSNLIRQLLSLPED